MSTLFNSAQQLLAAQGQDLGRTDWLLLTQERINLFAEASGDHQWIHVDPERAATGPFGACIAHGYLTLALANLFMPQLMQFANLAMGVNYGSDRLRFPAPVKVGACIRGRGEILKVDLARPRERLQLAHDSRYHEYRSAVLEFLYQRQQRPAA